MNRALVLRVGLVVLGAPSVLVGFWAGLAPRSFYDDFPGFGRSWVVMDGPYNEHLARDVGWLNLAIALVSLFAAWTLARALVHAAIGAWLVYGVPHLLYHVTHLDAYSSSDQVLMLTSLAVAPVVAIALLVVERSGSGPGATMPASTVPSPSSRSST